MRSGDIVARRFHVERFAGAGAMGLVYRARDAQTGEWVALKVLAHGSAERFLREARALSEVSHPHIVRYVDHGHTEAGEPYLAMEWLEGTDLAQKLLAGLCPSRRPLGLARSIAGALAVAHGRGVVHRDVKPSNLFLVAGDPARVKVLDFGAARFIRTTSAPTASGIVLGTPGYLAPEQVNDEQRGRRARRRLLARVRPLRVPRGAARVRRAARARAPREDPARGPAAPAPARRRTRPRSSRTSLDRDAREGAGARPADMTAIAETLGRIARGPAKSPARLASRRERALVFRWWSVAASDHFYTTEASGERALPCGYTYEGARFQTLREGIAGHGPALSLVQRAPGRSTSTRPIRTASAPPPTGYQLEGILGYVATSELPGHRGPSPLVEPVVLPTTSTRPIPRASSPRSSATSTRGSSATCSRPTRSSATAAPKRSIGVRARPTPSASGSRPGAPKARPPRRGRRARATRPAPVRG